MNSTNPIIENISVRAAPAFLIQLSETFKEVKINKGTMKVKLPAKSIVTLELQ